MSSVYIRPLTISDAQVSYHWRNNPRIWRFTGARPDKFITPELETAWLSEVLKKVNEKRFAICLTDDDKYIGNIFFTDMEEGQAQMHIFIGEMSYWGNKRAHDSICMILEYGFKVQELNLVYVQINTRNAAALALGKLVGFKEVSEYHDSTRDMMLTKMIFTRQMYEDKLHLNENNEEQLLG